MGLNHKWILPPRAIVHRIIETAFHFMPFWTSPGNFFDLTEFEVFEVRVQVVKQNFTLCFRTTRIDFWAGIHLLFNDNFRNSLSDRGALDEFPLSACLTEQHLRDATVPHARLAGRSEAGALPN